MEESVFSFKLVDIVTNQFAVIEEHYTEEKSSVEVSLQHTFGIDFERQTIAVKNNIQFLSDNQIFMIVEVTCFFQLHEKSWEGLLNDKGDIIIPKSLATHLLVLTVGTTRGVLHAKTENTKFNKYFLPTLDVSQLIENDIIFEADTTSGS